jgi:hypothetical protein
VVAKVPQEAVPEIRGQDQVLTVVGDPPALPVGGEQAVGPLTGALVSDELCPSGGLGPSSVLQGCGHAKGGLPWVGVALGAGGLQGLEGRMGGIEQHHRSQAVGLLEPDTGHDPGHGGTPHPQRAFDEEPGGLPARTQAWDGRLLGVADSTRRACRVRSVVSSVLGKVAGQAHGRPGLPGGLGGSWGAGSGGCTPPGGPAPASPARTVACSSPDCLAGRSALPLDRGDGGHRGMPRGRQGQAVEPTKSAIDQIAGRGRLRCWVGWWGACGWGSGMPGAVRQIPPPWAWWENEAPAARAACSSSQAQPVRLSTSCRCGVGVRSAGRWNSAPEGLCGRTTVRT